MISNNRIIIIFMIMNKEIMRGEKEEKRKLVMEKLVIYKMLVVIINTFTLQIHSMIN